MIFKNKKRFPEKLGPCSDGPVSTGSEGGFKL